MISGTTKWQTKDQIKIIHLIASSGLYGAEKWIYALMRVMDTAKFTSSLVNLYDVTEGQSAVVSGAKERGLDALDFNTGGRFNPFAIVKFARWLKSNRVDIVHGHGYKADLIGLVASRMVGCKVMTTPHGWSKEEDRKLMFYEALDRFTFRFMDYVCPLSVDLLNSVISYSHSDKLKLILNGVDIDEVVAQSAIERNNLDCFRIGYIGQLIERKNLKTLIFAFNMLLDADNNVELVIVGDGPLLHNLQLLVSDLGINHKTHFMGYRTDALSLLKSFDVFVLPSQLEGIPRCLMETMAAGVLVVASDIPGNRDLISHEKTGWLFPVNDEKILYTILKKIIDNRGKFINVVECAKQLIYEKFSNRKVATNYESIYLELSKQRVDR